MYLAPSLTHPNVQSLSLSPGIACLAPHMESPMLPTKVFAGGAAKLMPVTSNNPKIGKVNFFMPTSAKSLIFPIFIGCPAVLAATASQTGSAYHLVDARHQAGDSRWTLDLSPRARSVQSSHLDSLPRKSQTATPGREWPPRFSG